jgi:hypothetical protein
MGAAFFIVTTEETSRPLIMGLQSRSDKQNSLEEQKKYKLTQELPAVLKTLYLVVVICACIPSLLQPVVVVIFSSE